MALQSVYVSGGGLSARLTALALAQAGRSVTLLSTSDALGLGTCSHTAGGMLAPWSEALHTEPFLMALLTEALEGGHWSWAFETLGAQPTARGAVFAVPRRDPQWSALLSRRLGEWGFGGAYEPLAEGAGAFPQIRHEGWKSLFFPNEMAVNPKDLLAKSLQAMALHKVDAHWDLSEAQVQERLRQRPPRVPHFSLCGLGGRAAQGLPLRGVRGDTLLLEPPQGFGLTALVRAYHPRCPVYIVPHGPKQILVGATSHESEDRGPPPVQSLLELLGLATQVLPELSEARFLGCQTHLRPAFSDNAPRFWWCDRTQEGGVNGLYRHGILMAPFVARALCQLHLEGCWPASVPSALSAPSIASGDAP